jgi:hypothetical protein
MGRIFEIEMEDAALVRLRLLVFLLWSLLLSGMQAEQLLNNVEQASEAMAHCHKVAQHPIPALFLSCVCTSLTQVDSAS